MTENRTVTVTYREIAERFGIGIEGARLKAKRRAAKGLWRIIPGNHPQDIIRVEIPEDEFASGQSIQRWAPNAADEDLPTSLPPPPPKHRDTKDLNALVEIIPHLTAQLAAMTDKLVDAERGKAEAERDAAIARAALESAESRLAALQEQHIAALKDVREQMEAEAATARSELAEWKARPWWRRLAG